MHIDLVGIGMDGTATLTLEAVQAIREADILIGARRMLETVPEDGRKRFCAYESDKIADCINHSGVSRVAVLLSGDVGFFSGAKRLREALTEHAVRLLPGISSLSYFCAKMAIPWDSMHVISLHGTAQNVAVHVLLHERTFFLLGGTMTAAGVCQRLCDFGLEQVRVSVGVRLGYPDEQILTDTAGHLCSCETAPLSVLIAENPNFLRYLPSGIADTEFRRGDVPMTKAVVRGITVSSLHIAQNSVCWDIGCGTGSVSVEMALRCPDGQIYAVDKNAAAIALSADNARKFSCDNIIFKAGTAPDVLQDLPAPDCVFIGGSEGMINAIFEVISQKNKNARIAVNAVTLETLCAVQSAFQKRGCPCEITQIAVNPMRKIGDVTMFQAQNPIFLVQGGLQ